VDRESRGTGRVIRNKDARGRDTASPSGERERGGIKKRRAAAWSEGDADLFAEYVYAKGAPSWRKRERKKEKRKERRGRDEPQTA